MIKVFFADLTHTAQGIMSKIFPIGTATVAAYACQELPDEIDVKLFKFPEELDKALSENIPVILCLSNYSWNLQMANTFAKAAKMEKPDLIVILGALFAVGVYEDESAPTQYIVAELFDLVIPLPEKSISP